MGYDFALYEKRDHIAYVTINRPEVMNALHDPADVELSTIWDDFQSDDRLWVAILTGYGDAAFCAGRDLKWAAQHPGSSEWTQRSVKGGFGGIAERFDLTKPV